jgi:hypothetical protein
MGINRMTATEARANFTLGSMNVIQLETEQAVEHPKLMVSHLRKEDEIGRMAAHADLNVNVPNVNVTNCKFRQGCHGLSYANPERRHECTLTTVMPLTHGHSLIASEATSDSNQPHGCDRNIVLETDLSWMM